MALRYPRKVPVPLGPDRRGTWALRRWRGRSTDRGLFDVLHNRLGSDTMGHEAGELPPGHAQTDHRNGCQKSLDRVAAEMVDGMKHASRSFLVKD